MTPCPCMMSFLPLLLLSPPALSLFGIECNFYNSLLPTIKQKWGLGRENASPGSWKQLENGPVWGLGLYNENPLKNVSASELKHIDHIYLSSPCDYKSQGMFGTTHDSFSVVWHMDDIKMCLDFSTRNLSRVHVLVLRGWFQHLKYFW